MKSFFDRSLILFLAVGAANTIVGAVLMLAFYRWAGMGYWGASALSYLLASVMSFFLNRRFTFASKAAFVQSAARFAVNIAVCYLIAYSAAKPAVEALLARWAPQTEQALREQAAMLFGMVLFTFLNYIGQRYGVFRKNT